MTNTSTVVNDAVRALVGAMRARTGFRSCWADDPTGLLVPVYHSAEVGLLGDHAVTSLVVADIGDIDAPQEAGDGPQRVATLGTLRHRDEDATIRCRATAVTGDAGDGVVQATWDAATAIADAVDAELRGATGVGPSLGLVPAYRDVTARFAGVTGIRPDLSAGCVVDVLFDVAVRARI